MRRLALLACILTLVACDGEQGPESLVMGQDLCVSCRMPVSDQTFAAQITSPGELPRFFDDPGCLADFIRSGKLKEKGAVAWVADHRTAAWVRADHAVYTRVPSLATPMNHRVVAHASTASRDSDPATRGGEPLALRELFGPEGPPAGGRS